MLGETQVLEIIPVEPHHALSYGRRQVGFRSTLYQPEPARAGTKIEIVAWQNAVNEFDPRRGARSGRRRPSCLVLRAARTSENTMPGHIDSYSALMIIIDVAPHVFAAN